jgi:deoxycytidylate deaminase
MLKLKELFDVVQKESTCQKRAVVCILVSKEGRVVSSGANRCEPTDGICSRLGLIQNKEKYDTTSTCNWTHAEVTAIQNLPEAFKPYKAFLRGHEFFCTPCEEALKGVGVEKFEIVNE